MLLRPWKLGGSLILALSLPLAAQTFVVDAANGPGTNFTSIVAAVAAVPDGAVLLVHPGTYAGFTLAGRSLTILAGPGVVLNSSVAVTSTSAVQRVALAGLQFVGASTSANGSVLEISGCAGPVCIDDCLWQSVALTVPPSGFLPPPPVVLISAADQVLFRGGALKFCLVSRAHVMFERTTLQGVDTQLGFSSVLVGTPGLLISGGGEVSVAGGSVSGGNGSLGLFSDQRGIVSDGILRLLGGVTVRAGCYCNGGASAIYATGTTYVDPSAILQPTSFNIPISGPGGVSGPVVNWSMPAVTGASAAPGGMLTASTPFPVGPVTALLLGFPGRRATATGFIGELWLDPALPSVVLAFGPAPLSVNVNVPNSPLFLGTMLAWQSVVYEGGLFELSNPSWVLVR